MRLGILADIHEDNERLERAVDLLHRERVDQFVVLGDIFETGRSLKPAGKLTRRSRY